MKRKLLSALILSCLLGSYGTVLGAAPDTDKSEQQIAQTIDTMEKEIKVLRERISNMEKTKAEKKDVVKPTITFNGDSRTRFIDKHVVDGSTTEERIRLGIKAEVSKDIELNARMMLLDNNEMGTTGTKDRVQLIDGNFTHKNLFGTNYVTLGRFSQNFLATKYWSETSGRIDGIKVGVGNKVKLNVAYANWAPATTTAATYKLATVGGVANVSVLDKAEKVMIEDALFADVSYALNKDTMLYGMWLKEDENANDKNPFDVRGIGVSTKLNSNLALLVDYTDNIAMTQGSGYYASLRFKEANKAVPKSWGMRLDYRKVEKNNNVSGITGVALPVANVKGPAFSLHYAPEKNWVINAYQGFNTKTADTNQSTANYTRIEAIYNF